MARALTSEEIAILLDPENTEARPSGSRLTELVDAHRGFVAQFGWDQAGWAQSDDLPIPVRGLTVTVPGPAGVQYRVIIYPDASGALHFIEAEDQAEKTLAANIDKSSYASPDAGLLAMLNDMVIRAGSVGMGATNLIGAAALLGGIVLAIMVVQEIRKSVA